jgi:hypothetical protein
MVRVDKSKNCYERNKFLDREKKKHMGLGGGTGLHESLAIQRDFIEKKHC